MHKIFALLSLWTSLFTGAAGAQVFLTGQAARAVIGQSTFTSQTFGGTVGTTTTTGVPASDTVFGAIGGVAYGGNTLFATDDNRLGLLPQNNRVLMFNNIGQLFPAASAEIPPLAARCPLCGGQANVILGQPDFKTVTALNPPTAASLRLPLGVASDGHILAIADTANNRILLWKSLPATTGQAADLVLGQPDFVSFNSSGASSSSVRGPQGVWIQNGKLFVADTGDNRILIWNSIPSNNNQPADVVLGQPNFNSGTQYNLVDLTLTAAASIMASPTSVTSDGTHLFVTDLGFSRVLIWNSIPTQNQQPADVEIGQLDMTQSIANDTSHLCASNGKDTSGNPTYPSACASTLNFPRFALADDKGRLYVADGGNDRVLVYNQIPTTNAARADVILGQPDEFSDVVTSATSFLPTPSVQSAANVTPTPTSLAWDGANLYVADPTDYRILVFSPGTPNVALTGVVNSASQGIFAQGTVTIGGTITAKNTVTVTIGATGATTPPAYTYTVLSTDTLDRVAQGLVAVINAANSGAGDPNVLVYDRTGFGIIVLVARTAGADGDNITLSATVSASATITATANGGNLGGGGSAGQVAPGTLISINGTNLADAPVAVTNALTAPHLPWELGGVQVYFDGDRAPVVMVSPTQVNAQVPWELAAATSTSVILRITHADGSVTVTNAIGVPVLAGSPGVFAIDCATCHEPRAAYAFHGSSFATGAVTMSASAIQAGDGGTITIGDRPYSYTVKATDTLFSVRDAFIAEINADHEAPVTAFPGQIGFVVQVQARVPGPLGNGIALAVTTTTAAANFSSKLAMAATSKVTCCANVINAPVTQSNPAVAGETIFVVATGIGLVCTPANTTTIGNCPEPDPAKDALISGAAYTGPLDNGPLVAVDASAGGAGTVLAAGVVPGTIGIYQVVFQLPDSLTRNPFQQLTLGQNFITSNIVTIPIGDPLKF